jgi:acetyl-CoA carboxylase alpha subunit
VLIRAPEELDEEIKGLRIKLEQKYKEHENEIETLYSKHEQEKSDILSKVTSVLQTFVFKSNMVSICV